MNRSRGLLTLTALLGVALCGTLYHAVHSAGPAETGGAAKQPGGGPATAEPQDLAALRREVAGLKAEVWAQGQRSANPPKPEAPDRSAAKDPRTDPEARAEQERAHREYMAGIDDAFRKETMDPRWSSATSVAIQAAITGNGDLRSLVRGIECRSRSCRVKIADDGSGRLGQLLPMFALQVGHELPSIAADRVVDASGAATMVLYLSHRDDAQAKVP